MRDTSCLTLDLKAGESVQLDGGQVVVELLQKSGRTARLRVVAPRQMLIEKTPSTSESNGAALAPCMP